MIVLDMHIWHWWTNQIEGKLSAATIALIEETEEVAVSDMSCFEMALLHMHGRIDLGMSVDALPSEVEVCGRRATSSATCWPRCRR